MTEREYCVSLRYKVPPLGVRPFDVVVLGTLGGGTFLGKVYLLSFFSSVLGAFAGDASGRPACDRITSFFASIRTSRDFFFATISTT